MKKEVAKELPPRTDQILYVELDEAERVTYDAIRAAYAHAIRAHYRFFSFGDAMLLERESRP